MERGLAALSGDDGASEIYDGFARQLAGWESRYAGRPQREMLRLCLLALDREENVAVAYHARSIGPRLASLPVPEDVREVIRAALLWVWRDEEVHAVYMHATLLEIGAPFLRARALLQQTAGAIGGWTVAVRQHRSWSQAPLSRAAATLVLWAGAAGGRVPREVRSHIAYSSFREFCLYNAQTERTAWLCFQRLAALRRELPDNTAGRADDFARFADDEDRHRRIFAALGEALTDGDRLREGLRCGELAARVGL